MGVGVASWGCLVAMNRVHVPFLHFVLKLLLIPLQGVGSTAVDVIDGCAKGMLELPSKVRNPVHGLAMQRKNISICTQ